MSILQRNTMIIDPRVYVGNQAITVQSFTESNIKNGTQFAISQEINLTAGETRYYAFSTPPELSEKDVIIKTRLISTDGGMRYTPRVGANFTLGTELDIIVNLNSQSSNENESKYFNVPNGNVVSEGDSFDVVRSATGQGNQAVSGIFEGSGIERILPREATVLLKFENLENKATFIIFSVAWHEGELSVNTIM